MNHIAIFCASTPTQLQIDINNWFIGHRDITVTHMDTNVHKTAYNTFITTILYRDDIINRSAQ